LYDNKKKLNIMNEILKRNYIAPTIELIKLDNEISLQLESEYPEPGPGEGGIGASMSAPDFINSEPFKTHLG
jgi:hypothetical protein